MKQLAQLILVSSLIIFSTPELLAQEFVTVVGALQEANGSEAIPYASVTAHETGTESILTGTSTDDQGKFELNIATRNFYIELSFMGYITKRIESFEINSGKVDLGVVQLLPDAQLLDEVVIEGEVSKTVFQLDKRVFNVGKDISSTGMSALEVLNNVPSVTVSIEGDVNLRGSGGVQILIDGKPSVLADDSGNALGSITADMIDRIEVITNPSAKYEASGTSGILNIVLKKEEKTGWNGSISVNTGTPDNHSIGGSINRRTEKFNFFTQFGAGYRSLPRLNETINTNKITGERLINDGEEFRNEGFFNLTLGADYYLNESNVLTLSGNFAYELEDQPSVNNFSLFRANDLISSWQRSEVTEATNPKWQYEFNWKKTFEENDDHSLQFSALGRSFSKDQSSRFEDVTKNGLDRDDTQLTATNYSQVDYTFKADYVNPITDEWSLETGAMYVINSVGNDFTVEDFVGGEFVVNPNFTNDFEWNQNVLGIYATGAYENDVWGVKLGLRAENTDLNTLLVNTQEENDRNFTNFFPTFHTSYKITEKFSLQAGYSRRIFRPRLWDLNPFFNFRNNFSIRVGNPDLLPEFTDSYEITSIYYIGEASLSSSLYHRFTNEVVERVTTFEDDIAIRRPENLGTNSTIGFETNGKFDPTKWLSLNFDFNYNYFNRKGSFETQVFDFQGDQWSARLGNRIKLPASFDIELTGSYRSGFKTVQGRQSGFAHMDFGVRKKILKGKIVANLGIRDVFASRIQESFVDQPHFEVYSYGLRGRFITLGVSYGFGKGEAMVFSGRRR